MRVLILANPRSGRGRALRKRDSLLAALKSRGHDAEFPEITGEWQQDNWRGTDRLVIIGGDGTVHHAAAWAASSGIPLYHLATGTENLFARSFGMSREPATVVAHLEEEFAPRRLDLGLANGLPFLLMCSLGIDASVIHRFEDARGAKGGHFGYIKPVIAEGLRPRFATVRIEVDGEVLADPHSGTVVVSNLPTYALRLDPCFDADPSDGQLNVAMLPSTTSIGAAFDLLRCKLRSRSIRRARGRKIRITSMQADSAIPVQIDGERPRETMALPQKLPSDDAIDFQVSDMRLVVHAKPS